MVSLMNKYKYVLFDLDGTKSESALGIRKSLEHTISVLGDGADMPDLSDYTLYIGPPLLDTFKNLCHFSEEKSREGVEIYRAYYDEYGKTMNRLYDGIADVLKKLKEDGCKVAVCSSKYEKFAGEIIEILGVSEYFDAICGSTLDGSRKDKKDLIPYAVKSLGGDFENERESVIMLGDTFFDARGARQCEVDFVGVEYGYGDVQMMKDEGASVFAKTPVDIIPLLSK